MIAISRWTSNDQTTITDLRVSNYSYTITHNRCDIPIIVEKTLNQLSLEKLKESIFIPRKIELKRMYKPIFNKIVIRNSLPMKIKIDEKANIKFDNQVKKP